MGNKFYSTIQASPMVAAVKDIDKIESAIQSPSEIVFLLTGNIFNIKSIVDRVKSVNMLIYIHIDLMEGFSKDGVALRYIHDNIQPDGIITTKSNLIKIAKDLNIFAIQRLFILDSLSLETGIKSIHTTKPDAIEILPGIMPKVIKTFHQETRIPVIAGGLIKDKEDVIESLRAGAMGISTTREEVWYF
ncbi:MAG: glycerol-3-phosphate responsive antiterminator [Thermotaleaceae bacterium]